MDAALTRTPNFDWVGQAAILTRLQAALFSNRLPHATLFAGQPLCGKRTLARHVGQALLCQAPQQGWACGVCRACKRFAEGNHPDTHELKPQREQKTVGVGAMRELLSVLSLRPYEGDRSVVLVPGADTMTVQAQQAFLKSLEEPPPGTHFLITVVSVQALLPTLRSRCALLRMPNVAPDEIAAFLQQQGISPPIASACAALAQGSVGHALALAREDSQNANLEALQTLHAILAGSMSFAAASAWLQKQKQALDGVLSIWLTETLAAIKGQNTPLAALPPARLLRLCNAMDACMRAGNANAFGTAVCDRLLLDMMV